MSDELQKLGEGDLNGFSRIQRPSNSRWGFQTVSETREAAVASAMELVVDVITGRTPYYALLEAIQPRTPQMVQAIQQNYPGIIREGLSVSDFPLLMGDVLDRMLLARFREYAGAWRQYIKLGRPARDFRNVRRIKTDGGDGQWDQLTEYGGLKYTKLDETGYLYAPELYGKAIKLSFRSIMNDDLGAFEEIPNILARGGRRTVAKFATGLMFDSNGPLATFFTLPNGNLLAGNPALTIASLGTGIEQLAGFVDSEGEPIIVEGVRLVYGPGLRVTAQNLLNQLTVDMTTAGGTSGQTIRVNNWIVQGLTAVEDPYIPIIATTNGDTSWGLFADPNAGRPAAELAFLNGFAEPVLYQKQSNTARVGGGVDQMAGDFHSMAQEYKGVIGFGGTQMEPKAAVASNGSGV